MNLKKNLQTLFLNQMVSKNLVLQNDATLQIIIFYLRLHFFFFNSLGLNIFYILYGILICKKHHRNYFYSSCRCTFSRVGLLLSFVDTKSFKRHWSKIGLEKIIKITSYKLRFKLHYNIRRQNWPADGELEQDLVTHHQCWTSLTLCLNGRKSLQPSSWICSHME